jgi:hypothetical protein
MILLGYFLPSAQEKKVDSSSERGQLPSLQVFIMKQKVYFSGAQFIDHFSHNWLQKSSFPPKKGLELRKEPSTTG